VECGLFFLLTRWRLVSRLCTSCRFSSPTQVDPVLFPSQLYVRRGYLHGSIKNLTKGFYATDGQEFLVTLSADVFDVGICHQITSFRHCFPLFPCRMSPDLAHPTLSRADG
jgi:hypothetical protein